MATKSSSVGQCENGRREPGRRKVGQSSAGLETTDGAGMQSSEVGKAGASHGADTHGRHQSRGTSSEPTRGQLLEIEEALSSLDQKVRRLCAELPAPEFEPGTDRPLNAAAKIYGLLSATADDELRPAVLCLRRAAKLSAELSGN